MATPAQALAAVASKVASDLTATRLVSDHRDDLQILTAGTLYFQLRGVPTSVAPRSGSSMTMALELVLAFKLDDTERAYTEGDLQSQVATLVDPEWWQVTEVAGVGGVGEIEIDRVGNVVTTTLAVQIEITGS